MPELRPVLRLASRLGEDWPSIRRAEENTVRLLTSLPPEVAAWEDDQVAFVAFGSVARREVTEGSDLDWTLLVDAASDPTHFDLKLTVESALSAAPVQCPGPEETFGDLTFSHDLIHRIGGEEDTNRNMTRRILLLLESTTVGVSAAHHRVMRNVLQRYIDEDWGWEDGRGRDDDGVRVPRFLLNDFARYWRTVAVDFAYKRRDRGAEAWALRTVKLRLSRKMMYASGLLACFSFHLENVLDGIESPEGIAARAVEHLHERLSMPPLDVLAATALSSDDLHETSRVLFGAYDSFLQLLDNREKRNHLAKLSPGASSGDDVYEEARTIGHAFKRGLDGIFFGPYKPLSDLTRAYGIF